jgi:hypothetical protein
MKKKITVLALCAMLFALCSSAESQHSAVDAVPGGQGDQMTGYTLPFARRY